MEICQQQRARRMDFMRRFQFVIAVFRFESLHNDNKQINTIEQLYIIIIVNYLETQFRGLLSFKLKRSLRHYCKRNNNTVVFDDFSKAFLLGCCSYYF